MKICFLLILVIASFTCDVSSECMNIRKQEHFDAERVAGTWYLQYTSSDLSPRSTPCAVYTANIVGGNIFGTIRYSPGVKDGEHNSVNETYTEKRIYNPKINKKRVEKFIGSITGVELDFGAHMVERVQNYLKLIIGNGNQVETASSLTFVRSALSQYEEFDFTDHETYLVTVLCSVEGETSIWVLTRNPAKMGDDTLAVIKEALANHNVPTSELTPQNNCYYMISAQ